MSIVSDILSAANEYRKQALPAPTLIVSEKILNQIQAECEYTCGCDKQGQPIFLGMRWMLDIDMKDGWRLREDHGNA